MDLASTLIAMFRSLNIHSRYVVGTVQVPSAQVMNWLGVTNLALAVTMLQDQGIQGVYQDPNNNYVQFEHTWVEAYLPYGDYRGAGSDASNLTCGTPSDCHWVALDPSFKQNTYNAPIDVYNSISFNYGSPSSTSNSYYYAIANNDLTQMNKNPLEIYENQVLAYVGAGSSLESVEYTGTTVGENTLILPASLPYTVVSTGAARRYNSVTDHDAAVTPNGPEPVKWGKSLIVNLYLYKDETASGGPTVVIDQDVGPFLLASLATQRLTLTTEIEGGIPNMIVRLGGTVIATPISGNGQIQGYTPTIGDSFAITVGMDGSPSSPSQATCQDYWDLPGQICATYNAVIGGYYLLATGGETSNWSQVHNAANQLLENNQQNYKIVFNLAQNGVNTCAPNGGTCICNTSTGLNCTPYVDTAGTGVYSSNDPELLNDQQAMDDLTGGLLYVAAMQYFTKLREDIQELDALNHVKSPIAGFLGVVSSTYEMEYMAGTAFSVLPGGLLIDMKGITLSGSWRINQPTAFSNPQFLLIGHIMSSLEHETWQELTGYDAISTVRGIQMAMAPPISATLLNPIKNSQTDNLSTIYPSLGFSVGSAPSGWTYTPFTIFSTAPATWTAGASGALDVFLSSVSASTSQNLLTGWEYQYSTNSGLYGWCYCVNSWVSQLQALPGNAQVNPFAFCDGNVYSGQVSTILSQIQGDYLNTIIPYDINYVNGTPLPYNQGYFAYFDRDQGFVTANNVFRVDPPPAANLYSTDYVMTVRNDLYLNYSSQNWLEYWLPSTQVLAGSNYFAVDIREVNQTSTSSLTQLTFEIQNESISAGGGYVPADGMLLQQATSIPVWGARAWSPPSTTPIFTDKNTIAATNNDTSRPLPRPIR